MLRARAVIVGLIAVLLCPLVLVAAPVWADPLPTLAENQWGSVPGTALLPVIPTTIGGVDPRLLGGNARPDKAIMSAWSGGVWADAIETLFVHGGGHADGAISNLFALPMSTLAWRVESPQASVYRLDDPLMGPNGLDTNPDGTPAAIHSWGGLGYLPATNQVFRTRGDRWSNSGGPTSATWRWGPIGSGVWTRLTGAPEEAEAIVLGWHTPSRTLLVQLSHWLWGFDPAASGGVGSWTKLTQEASGGGARQWMVWDSKRNRVLAFSGTKEGDLDTLWIGQVSVVDLSSLPASVYIGQPSTRRQMTGAIPSEWAVGGWTSRVNGFYDPDRDVVVHWGGGRDWYLMDANFNWTKVTGAGVDPGDGLTDRDGQKIQGHFGRVFYMRARGLYAVVTDVQSNVFVYRPAGSAPTPIGLLPLKPGWTKLDLPLRGFGVPNGKHQQWAKNPENGRWYIGGGDYGNKDFNTSYPQEKWSVDLAAWLAGDRNAGWVQEQPYCRADGKVQPKHTDHVGWTWDLEHKKFVMLPGVMFGSNDVCPGETIQSVSDPLFIFDRVMAFDPATKDWEVWPSTGNTAHNNENFGSVYDAPRKRHLHFADDGNGQGASAYYPGVDPKTTGQWKRIASNLQYATPQRHSQRMYLNFELLAIDRVRWQVYVIDYYNKKLVRYDLATDTVEVLADPPAVQDQSGGTFNGVAFSQRHDLVFFLPHPNPPTATKTLTGLYAYHVSGPLAGTWETLSLDTGLGYDAFGRTLFYDEEGDALVSFLQGDDNDFRSTFAFLYRYSGTAPPLMPIAPSGAAAAPVASGTGNVLAWVDNSTNEDRFNIQWKLEACSGALPFVDLDFVGANVTTYIHLVSAPGTYCYRVNASNASGVSAYSNTAEKTILAPPIGFPIGTVVETTTALNVRVCAGTACPVAGSPQPLRARGTVTGEPTVLSGQEWYQMDYAAGADGWSSRGPLAAPYLRVAPPPPMADFHFTVPSGKTYQINGGPIVLVP